MKVQSSVAGKVVLITGGASGLGLATGQQLAARGARIALVDLFADQVTEAAGSCGPDALGLVADITDGAAVTAALQQTADTFGRVDVVMANAGVACWGPVLTIDPERWERTLEINLTGTWRTARAALPFLLDSSGYLLLTASLGAAVPMPAGSAYGVSKAGVDALGRAMRIELKHHGIDVGIGYYGFLDTPLMDNVGPRPGFMADLKNARGPLARMYPVKDAAEATAAGIAVRAQRIMFPSLAVRAVLAVRGFVGPRFEAQMMKSMPALEAEARKQAVPSAEESTASA